MTARSPSIAAVRRSLDTIPGIVVLESLYSRNDLSPICSDKSVNRKYSELCEKTQTVLHSTSHLDHIENSRQFPFTTAFAIAEMIVLALNKTPEILLECMNPDYSAEYLSQHSLNVAFIACRIAMKLDMRYSELLELGVAALLHDIGMTKVNKDNYLHERMLTAAERYSIEDHPVIGWQFFKELQEEFPWLLRVILEEHKREHSQGYPEAVEGDIHPYSKIVGLADSFEALSHARIFRKAFHPTDALKVTIEGNKIYFDKYILRAMIDALSMYPVGSLVQLNNNRTAQVIEANEFMPMRPVVRMMESRNNRLVPGNEIVDLAHDSMCYITTIVYSDNYQPSDKTRTA